MTDDDPRHLERARERRAQPELTVVRPSADSVTDEREAAFDGLYAAHQRTLHAFLLGRTGDPELALDLLQEAFVRAWRNLDLLLTFGPSGSVPWLFSTARNLVIDQYRGRATGPPPRTRSSPAWIPPSRPRTAPSASSSGTASSGSVDEAIRRLPEPLRTVLVLQVLDERTSAEIGDCSGGRGTVRYQISQARKRLAEELRRLEAAPDVAADHAPDSLSLVQQADPVHQEV